MATRQLWLFKTEPAEYSIDDLARDGCTVWTGVRNYQVRNLMRDAMKRGDEVLVYHSSCAEPGAVGTAIIEGEAHPDPSQFDPASPYHDPGSSPTNPRWLAVDVAFRTRFAEPVTLAAMRAMAGLAELAILRRGNRLSITPVTPKEWSIIVRLGSGV